MRVLDRIAQLKIFGADGRVIAGPLADGGAPPAILPSAATFAPTFSRTFPGGTSPPSASPFPRTFSPSFPGGAPAAPLAPTAHFTRTFSPTFPGGAAPAGISNLGTLPTDPSISTSTHVLSLLEARPGFMATSGTGVPGERITSLTGIDSHADVFQEVGGAGPTLRYDDVRRVYFAQYAVAQYLINGPVNSGTWAARVASGVSKASTHHWIGRIDDLPNALGSAIMCVCSSANNQNYIQDIVTQPASNDTRFTRSKRGTGGSIGSTFFNGAVSRGQLLNIYIVDDGTNTSFYCEGTRIGTGPTANSASMTPNTGIIGALSLAGVLLAFSWASHYSSTWYDIALSVAQMREIDDAYSKPRFFTRGNLTNGKLTVLKADAYQTSTVHCAPWRSSLWTQGGIQYAIAYTQSDSRVVELRRPVTSDTWDGGPGDSVPAEHCDPTWDGHRNPSGGKSGDGRTHVAFNMHGHPMSSESQADGVMETNGITAAGFGNFLPYSFSYINAASRTGDTTLVSGDVGKMARQTDNDSSWILLTPSPSPTWRSTWGELSITYPDYVELANGDILFIVRDGRSGQGFQPVLGWYNSATGARTHLPIYVDEGTGPDPYNFYCQRAYDPIRNRLWFSGVCRHGASAGVQSNEGIYCWYIDTSGTTFGAFDVLGNPLTLPMSNATMPKIANVGFNRELINQQTMTIDPATGFPIILMHYAPAVNGIVDMHAHYWDGSAWQQRALGILTQNHSYGEPAGTIANPGAALPATTGAVIGRAGSLAYGGVLRWWMCASQWGQGVFEFTLPISQLGSATPTKTKIISDETHKDMGPGALWATWEGQVPDAGRLSANGIVAFTFQRAAFDPPADATAARARAAWPLYVYERTLPGTPIAA